MTASNVLLHVEDDPNDVLLLQRAFRKANVALNIQLKIGQVGATVDVKSDLPLINESSAVATVVDRQFVENVPLNGRSFQSLITLTPGIVLTPGSTNTSGQFSVNGQRSSANAFMVDGVSANFGAAPGSIGAPNTSGNLPALTTFGTTQSLVSVDALQEFKVQTSTYSAEYGRQPGAQVSIVTRSGGNQFHGSGVWTARNTAFDANTWANNRAVDPKTGASKPTQPNWYNNHQLTASLGGPLVKNKTFFFALFDTALMNGRTVQNPVVLTPCARKGIFRYFDNWNNGNFYTTTQATGGTPTIAVVDAVGNPVAPATNPNTGGRWRSAVSVRRPR